MSFMSANLRTKYSTSASSSLTARDLSGSDIIASTSPASLNLNRSRSSEASVTIPIARSLGLWNRAQSLSSQNPLTMAFRESTVESESLMPPGTRWRYMSGGESRRR